MAGADMAYRFLARGTKFRVERAREEPEQRHR